MTISDEVLPGGQGAGDAGAAVDKGAQPPSPKVPAIAIPSQPVALFNREFSWLAFNRRVLAEAEDPTVPLLERVKFLSITASNLDEFLMVRVGGIQDLLKAGIAERSADGLTPKQQLKGIRERAKKLLDDEYVTLAATLAELRKSGIRIERVADLSKKDQQWAAEHFEKHVAPILTPLAIDPGHPFPFLANLALNLAVVLESERGDEHVVFLKIPPLLPRFIEIDGNRFVRIEDVVAVNAGRFFPGLKVRKVVAFRVVRNADIALREDEVQDLLLSVESELRRRERKEVVWIELGPGAPDTLVSLLTGATKSSIDDVFQAPDFLRIADLMQIYTTVGKPSLREVPFNPRIPSQLATTEDMFSIIRKGDLLLHRPYDSFGTVVEFIQSASDDPDVVAIKQTLYRTDTGSPIVEALAQAALRGKHVTAVVELQARFDESKNIEWARRLEEAGVQVVYGLVGIKTHCKLCLVVRREGTELKRYVHLSTGNYNARTGRLYTDIDLFTQDESFGEDASQLMNILTGFSLASAQEIFEGNVPALEWKRFVVAPMDYHKWVLQMIRREVEHAQQGRPAEIIARLNALVDPMTIQALYDASSAGVKIELVVRGICCLVPGVEGMSENIRVVSVVDRFLEHARIMLFRNGGEAEIYVSSGDWMPRNFFRRIELTFPIVSDLLRNRIEQQILATALADNVKAWRLTKDGTYKKRTPGSAPAVRSQERFIEIARADSVKLGPYDEIIKKPGSFRRKMKRPKKKKQP